MRPKDSDQERKKEGGKDEREWYTARWKKREREGGERKTEREIERRRERRRRERERERERNRLLPYARRLRSTVRAHERCYRPPRRHSGLLWTTHRQNNKHGMRHTRPSVRLSVHRPDTFTGSSARFLFRRYHPNWNPLGARSVPSLSFNYCDYSRETSSVEDWPTFASWHVRNCHCALLCYCYLKKKKMFLRKRKQNHTDSRSAYFC